jgi:8-oxo-dGTP diphosphatase
MKNYNCIIILNKEKNQLLFCKRSGEPYTGLYNFVGGKIEEGEGSLEAAYRELEEETGITIEDTQLQPFMDYVWHIQQIRMEVYVGILKREVQLRVEKHPLLFMDLNYNFFDMTKFAGEGNIGHMIEIMKMSGLIAE